MDLKERSFCNPDKGHLGDRPDSINESAAKRHSSGTTGTCRRMSVASRTDSPADKENLDSPIRFHCQVVFCRLRFGGRPAHTNGLYREQTCLEDVVPCSSAVVRGV
ncbi:hypothetical protein RESH_02078 [Rhodopirellula europaea SH398]|uniref:Uncharacterized protein n=1 Tax=Rhodopirellula europaea SH398 TaxID=1263868 RepID=M5S7C0_9BACT|nr:hypothetical protein RESH_02078 [Rhodopirellula europaea SH398]